MTAKKCTRKRDGRAKWLLIASMTFLLSSPFSLLSPLIVAGLFSMDISRQESGQISVLRLPFFDNYGTPEQSYNYFAIKKPFYWGVV